MSTHLIWQTIVICRVGHDESESDIWMPHLDGALRGQSVFAHAALTALESHVSNAQGADLQVEEL